MIPPPVSAADLWRWKIWPTTTTGHPSFTLRLWLLSTRSQIMIISSMNISNLQLQADLWGLRECGHCLHHANYVCIGGCTPLQAVWKFLIFLHKNVVCGLPAGTWLHPRINVENFLHFWLSRRGSSHSPIRLFPSALWHPSFPPSTPPLPSGNYWNNVIVPSTNAQVVTETRGKINDHHTVHRENI